ncbi:MAG: polysaccharide deacetylase [Parachlamydiales bacterium]|nr:polysaccharide deacetylase [Parachlamydiales bacterium]
MMLALLYHRVGDGKYANPWPMMDRHLGYIAKRYRTVWPGEPLHLFRREICLTFDDATFDFYYYIFPLLKKYQLRALLAVPVRYIQESSDLAPSIRLSIPYSSAMKGDIYRTHAPFCTWQELREMAHSGLVQIASHSYHHQNLLTPGLDLELDIAQSKKILEEKLGVEVRTFVYPLGKFNPAIHRQVKRHYDYAMRIGTAWNMSWQNISGMVYRVISDNLTSVDQQFCLKRKLTYLWFYLINTLRRR